MKLSEMKTDKALDILAEITPYLADIVQDEEIQKVWNDRINPEKLSKEELQRKGQAKGLSNLSKILSLVLKRHKETVYIILSLVNEKDIDVIKNQSPVTTIREIMEFVDKDSIDFLDL